MRINITTSRSKTTESDIACYFVAQGTHYSRKHVTAPGAPEGARPLHIGLEASRLAFFFDLARYKFYEEPEARRVAGGEAVRELRRLGRTQITWLLDGHVPLAHFCQLLAGALLADYRYLAYKTGKAANSQQLKLTIVAGENKATFQRELKRLQAIDAGVRTARDLANAPAGDLVPGDLADFAKQLAKTEGLSFKSLSAKQLEQRGYVGLASVGRGSDNPPVMFTLEHQPARVKRGTLPLCFVGKGVCFDAGGINLKPWENMWDMKADMGGAAAVVGAMHAIARLKLPVPVVAVIAAAQNLPDGKAYLPSDVLRYRNGRTVEIQNTDAEGRLVLADALLYAQETLKQRRIVDFATLTGACARALGQQYIGLMSRADSLKAEVMHAGELSGELAWELPLHPEYP
jgi:leucyl aminopeptidase